MFYNTCLRNKLGIPEPPATATEAAGPGDIDLLTVPGLSFETHGHRLGQGGRGTTITSSPRCDDVHSERFPANIDALSLKFIKCINNRLN